MSVTYSYVANRLPACLTQLVFEYFYKCNKPRRMAWYGAYEYCANLGHFAQSILYGGYQGNHRDIIDLAIAKGAKDREGCMYHICRGGHFQPTYDPIELKRGLAGACRGGHYDLAISIMANGVAGWDSGLMQACRGGHIEIVKLMADKWLFNADHCLAIACRGGHRDIIDFMIAKGARDWDWGLMYACRGGHFDIVKLMVSKGANTWDQALCVCKDEYQHIIEFLIAKRDT